MEGIIPVLRIEEGTLSLEEINDFDFSFSFEPDWNSREPAPIP